MSKTYEEQVLQNWEEVFRQGLLTYWVLLALSIDEYSVQDLRKKVAELTNNTYTTSGQVLYRLLRKHYDLELVNVKKVDGNRGPKKKLYSISDLGKSVLSEFSKRNISLFYKDEIKRLIKGENR